MRVHQPSTGNSQQQSASKPQYDVKFEPHPKLGAPFMVPVVLDRGK
jgi:hypothetical protein